MILKKISVLCLSLNLLVILLSAQPNQYGLPWIQNYHFAETGGSEQNWCITQDFRGVIYVGNHDKGILEYDGSTWRRLPVPGNAAVRSMALGKDGIVYVGLDGDYGRLEPDRSGDMQFLSLLDSAIAELFPDVSIWKTYYDEEKIYFCGMEVIFVFDPKTEQTAIIETSDFAFFSFLLEHELYLGDYGSGLLKYDGHSFSDVPGGGLFKEKNISGMVSFDSSHLLIATFSKGLFLLDINDGSVDSTFLSSSLKEALGAGEVVNLQIHGDNIFVGTLYNGLYILDRQGSLLEVYSEAEGLLDNSIIQVYIPPPETGSISIWIAHWMGVSRIDINSPFRSISVGRNMLGFEGRNQGELITDICEFKGKQYVSTFGGLQCRSLNAEHPGFIPVQGITKEIYDLLVIKPSPDAEFLLALSDELTYVIDQNLELSTLELGGRKLLSNPDNPSVFYSGRNVFSGYQYWNGHWKRTLDVELKDEANDMCLDKHGYVWISTPSVLLRLDVIIDNEIELQSYGVEEGLPKDEFMALFTDPESQELLVGSDNGFYRFDYNNDSLIFDNVYNSLLPQGENSILTFHKGADDLYWFSFENEYSGWSILGAQRDRSGFDLIYDKVFRSLSHAASTDVFFTDVNKQLWFSKSNELYHFDQSLTKEVAEPFQVLMRNVTILRDSCLFHGTYYKAGEAGHLQVHAEQEEDFQPSLKYLYRDIEFEWSSPYFKHEKQILYSYFLEGFSIQWSDWDLSRSAKFTNLSHGRYEMQVKARNVFGDESPPVTYGFSILRPWYATILAISLYFVLGASLLVFVILYTRKLKMKAELLERQNSEIELQKKELEEMNEEITAQRDEIEAQRDSITVQNELINQQNLSMTDSIRYARRIQDAVLPAKEVMRFLLPKHFIFYRPRDIVSGDFFWVDKKDETILIAIVDCTGHGVPGAFMSMLGISLLNEISSKYSDHPTNEIMDELRDQVIASLRQTGDMHEAKDGMEMGLIAINTKTREIQFTGAMHNLYIFQKGEPVVIRGDRMPVGIHTEGATLFSVNNLKLERGDTLYMFSDGYPDQFGGKYRKKFGTPRLRSLLNDLQNSIMHDQKIAVTTAFDEWKGDQDQIDDVLMIGIKV